MSSEKQAQPEDEQERLERETRETWERSKGGFLTYAELSGEPHSTFREVVEGQVNFARVTYQKDRAYTELDDASVRWDRLGPTAAEALLSLLNSEPKEQEVHKFLERNPSFLVQTLTGGHGRYQLSKPKLGSEYVPDFLIADMSSIGIEWHAVEIESPTAPVERKDGLATQELNHAIGQIRDWRTWIRNNLDYARRRKADGGLGLVGIDSTLPGLVLIGRRQENSERFNEFRRQMIDREKIIIHSYDWLVDVAVENYSGRLENEIRGED